MQITRPGGPRLAAILLVLAATVSGCGGSSTKATPPTGAGGASASAPAGSSVPGTSAPAKSGTTAAKPLSSGGAPTATQIAVVRQELDQAGTGLADGNSAVGASDVNQAKGQEGSAP